MQAHTKITVDRYGTPGIWSTQPQQAYFGMGYLHGFMRPVQVLLMHTAAMGRLAECLLPKSQLVELDALVRRLDLAARAQAEVSTLSFSISPWLDAYIEGLHAGLAIRGKPVELGVLLARLPWPTHQSTLASLMLAGFLGLGQGQERMEIALVEALRRGADEHLLHTMFAPHIGNLSGNNSGGYHPGEQGALKIFSGLAARPPLGFAGHGFVGLGGSNAWAIGGSRSQFGKPMLCGDPHLQINQLPSLFFELRARVGDDYWLGATIPGLPGMAVGRNRRVAWSGTFSCADNVDHWWVPQGVLERRRRTMELKRRFKRPLSLSFIDTEYGVLNDLQDGTGLCSRWASSEKSAESLEAYMRLPTAESAQEAHEILHQAHTMSLHFVLADSSGEIRYKQAGRIPKRSTSWSGLTPGELPRDTWNGFYEGGALPWHANPPDGLVVSANEARPAQDGGVLATLAQPDYRMERIRALLLATEHHSVQSMQAIQLDVHSLQAVRLCPLFLGALPDGPVKQALQAWDGCYHSDRVGAHAFETARRAALGALAPRLGGEWFTYMLDTSELGVWWLAGLDRLLAAPSTWQGPLATSLAQSMQAAARTDLAPWGDVQRLRLSHMIFGGLPLAVGLDRGEFALPGSVATVCQGNTFQVDGNPMAVGPAYRFIADLAHDEAWSSLPGGIADGPFSKSYTTWLAAWRQGEYHPLRPPQDDEGEMAGLS